MLRAVAVEGDTPSEPTPRPANIGVGLGRDPLLQGLLSDHEQGGTAALVLLAHGCDPRLKIVGGSEGVRHGASSSPQPSLMQHRRVGVLARPAGPLVVEALARLGGEIHEIFHSALCGGRHQEIVAGDPNKLRAPALYAAQTG